MELYFFDNKKRYILQCNNFYAYSIINNNFFKKIVNDYKKGNIFKKLNDEYLSVKQDEKLKNLRNKNHKNYNNLDIEFVKNVDKRYLSQASDVLKSYNSISSYKLLKENFEASLQSQNIINDLSKKIKVLKEDVSKDLISVIDYVDKKEEKINVSKILKDSPLGILIINKYHSLKLFSSKMYLDDANFEMKHQAKRLIYIKELEMLIRDYRNRKSIYDSKNTVVMINNLYKIISEYIYLLTDSEFCFTKEAIKKIIAFDYDFIEQYLPTYKIILNKIWNYEMENSNEEKFFYAICDIDLIDNNIYILNNYNKNIYPEKGYICEIPKDYFIECKISKQNILQIPLPYDIKEKYKLELNYDVDKLNILKIYTRKETFETSFALPTIILGGD